MRAKNQGSVLKYLHLNFMKFVRVFGDAEKLGLPGIRFFGFLGVELDVALGKLGFVGSNTSANFKI